jgi:hypothetical protein
VTTEPFALDNDAGAGRIEFANNLLKIVFTVEGVAKGKCSFRARRFPRLCSASCRDKLRA